MIGLRLFPLKSADVRGAGTRDEPLRTSAWEAMNKLAHFLVRKEYEIMEFLLTIKNGAVINPTLSLNSVYEPSTLRSYVPDAKYQLPKESNSSIAFEFLFLSISATSLSVTGLLMMLLSQIRH